MAIEDVTRRDLEQMFENQTELFMKETGRIELKFDWQFIKVGDQIADLHRIVKRIDRRTDEEIRDLYKRVGVLEHEVGISN